MGSPPLPHREVGDAGVTGPGAVARAEGARELVRHGAPAEDQRGRDREGAAHHAAMLRRDSGPGPDPDGCRPLPAGPATTAAAM
jgi:hypothetical protein